MPKPAAPILRSKLYRPPVTADLVDRERLQARLEASHRQPLSLISAPAGYGKTTLVSSWLETCELPAAWLSLDETEGDTAIFLQYLVAAVRSLFPDACQDTLELAGASELPLTTVLAGALSNDLDAIEEPFVLVLDDYHRLREPGVHELLDRLLSHPPRGLRLVIVSRRDPPLALASLRGRHLMTEIRMRDLQFTSRETAAFLEQAVGQPIDGPGLKQLQEATEGWPVALRLAAVVLRDDYRVDDLAHGMTGDSWQVREYLVAEVLSHQTPAVRDWLCKTSILERFCAPLARAVCGASTEPSLEEARSDALLDGDEFTQILENRGLFCVALDETRRWYRYHHLFQEVLQSHLRKRLDAEEIASLHARAAAWLEPQGLFEEAIRHLLECQDPTAAGRLMARHRHEIMNREQWQRLDRWLRWLPAEVVDDNPELLVLKAFSLQKRGRLRQMSVNIDRLEARLDASTDEELAGKSLRAELDALRAWRRYAEGRGDLAAEDAERALDKLPEECLTARGFATGVLAGARQMTGELERAYSGIYDAMATDPQPEPSYHCYLLWTLSMIHWMAADLPAVELSATRHLELATELGLAEASTLGRFFLGSAKYHRGQLDEAERLLSSVAAGHIVPNANYLAHGNFALASVYEAQGRSAEARAAAKTVVDYALDFGNKTLLGLGEAFSAELAIRQGRVAEAASWVRQLEADPFRPRWLFFAPEVTLAKVFLAGGDAESLDRAGDLLTSWQSYLAAIHNQRFQIEALALDAQLREARGDESAGLELLRRAVELALPGRWLRPFVDLGAGIAGLLYRLDVKGDALSYVKEILAAFGTQEPPGGEASSGIPPDVPSEPQPLVEPLTSRELEILALLAQRMSNREIADRLFISPGTVKRHAHNLYGKLGVPGRREAVTKAFGLGLLGRR